MGYTRPYFNKRDRDGRRRMGERERSYTSQNNLIFSNGHVITILATSTGVGRLISPKDNNVLIL